MTRDELRTLVAARFAEAHAARRAAAKLTAFKARRTGAVDKANAYHSACAVALDVTNDPKVSDRDAEERCKALFLEYRVVGST